MGALHRQRLARLPVVNLRSDRGAAAKAQALGRLQARVGEQSDVGIGNAHSLPIRMVYALFHRVKGTDNTLHCLVDVLGTEQRATGTLHAHHRGSMPNVLRRAATAQLCKRVV